MSDWRAEQLKFHRSMCGLANCALCDSGGPARPVSDGFFGFGNPNVALAWSISAWPDTYGPGLKMADKVPVHDGWPDDWASRLAEEWGAE